MVCLPSTSVLLRCPSQRLLAVRNLLRPPRNVPYRGIYRTEGEECMKNELLVCQLRMNYHPGLNVYLQKDRGQFLLKSHVDGRVMISREKIDPDLSIPENSVYLSRSNDPIFKLTFNVIPAEMSRTFQLRNDV